MNEPRHLFPQGEAECYRKRFNSLPGMHIDVERKAACQVLCRIGIGVAGALAFSFARRGFTIIDPHQPLVAFFFAGLCCGALPSPGVSISHRSQLQTPRNDKVAAHRRS